MLADHRVIPILQMLRGDMSKPGSEVQPGAGLRLEEALETVETLEGQGVVRVDRAAGDRLPVRLGENRADFPIGPPGDGLGRVP